MSDDKLKKAIQELKNEKDVKSALVVSRSGVFVEGDLLDKTDIDTFSAMAAIILGASETITSEFDETVNHTLIDLEETQLLVMPLGKKCALVLIIKKSSTLDDVLKVAATCCEKIKEII